MAILSHRSTYISNLELGSDQAYVTDAYLKIPSDGTFESAGALSNSGTITSSGTITNTGTMTSTGTLDLAGVLDIADGRFFLRSSTTTSGALANIRAGELSLASQSAQTIELAYRSGNTIYIFRSTATSG